MTATVLMNMLFYVFKFTNLCIIILNCFGNILELVFIAYLFFLQNYIFGIYFSTISIKFGIFQLVFFGVFLCFFFFYLIFWSFWLVHRLVYFHLVFLVTFSNCYF